MFPELLDHPDNISSQSSWQPCSRWSDSILSPCHLTAALTDMPSFWHRVFFVNPHFPTSQPVSPKTAELLSNHHVISLTGKHRKILTPIEKRPKRGGDSKRRYTTGKIKSIRWFKIIGQGSRTNLATLQQEIVIKQRAARRGRWARCCAYSYHRAEFFLRRRRGIVV